VAPEKNEYHISQFADIHIHFADEQKVAIHSLSGLYIGAETAEEIALSIISEIKMTLSKRNGKELKNKKEAIHAIVSPYPNTITLQRTG
jgi:xanthine/CO dehydrogenase XdhC/CoxF family maturation factor